VFTGTLSILGSQAADAAAAGRCRVDDSITKYTTMLVVGDWTCGTSCGPSEEFKTSGKRAANCQGQPIRILGESDFMRIVIAG